MNKAPEMAKKIADKLRGDPEVTSVHCTSGSMLGFNDAQTGERYIIHVEYVGRAVGRNVEVSAPPMPETPMLAGD